MSPGHWYALDPRYLADTRVAAARSARRAARPEMAHAHSIGEPCTFDCMGYLP